VETRKQAAIAWARAGLTPTIVSAMATVEGAPSRPSARSLGLIDGAIADVRPPSELREWFAGYAKAHSSRLALDLELVDRFAAPSAAIVEIGAVPLILTRALQRADREIIGVDLAPGRFGESIARFALRVETCDIETEQLPFADGSVDVVLFNEIFEHLRINPVHSLDEIRRILTPGGILLMSTPNLRSFHGLINLLVRGKSFAVGGDIYDEYDKLTRLGHMGHVREYAPGDIQALLDRLGFRLDRMVFRGLYNRRSMELAARLAPQFRPFVTYVAARV
jgi:SAM-dependent methyltransferase